MQLLNCDCVDINSTDHWGYTALTTALLQRHEAVVELLLRSKRADINLQDRLGATVLHYATIKAISDSVITIMLDNGADVNMKDCWAGTPFTWALKDGSASIVKLFVERNPEIEFFYRPLGVSAFSSDAYIS